MSQSCFSLGFFPQNSLWKLSTFCGYKSIYSGVYEECKKSCFNQTGHFGDSASQLERVMSLSRELIAWLDWKFCLVVLQLAWPFSSSACFTRVPPLVTRQLRDPVARLFLSAHILRFLRTFSHTNDT